MSNLPELRRDLVTAEDRLRDAKTALETAKTIATMHTAGTNDRERKKADEQALLDDKDYNKALAHLHACEYEVDRIETEIDVFKDERTARELSIREENNRVVDRLAAAYEAMARTNPVHAAIDDSLMRNQRPF